MKAVDTSAVRRLMLSTTEKARTTRSESKLLVGA